MTESELTALAAELTADPLGRGYAVMSDAAAADSLNLPTRTKSLAEMTGDKVFGATAASEFAALTSAKQQMWVSFCSRPSISPAIAANVEFARFIFGVGSQTVAALQAARSTAGTRGEELGLGKVTPSDVADARRSK